VLLGSMVIITPLAMSRDISKLSFLGILAFFASLLLVACFM
jgi:hypothetical protein